MKKAVSTTFACPADVRGALDRIAIERSVSIASIIVESLRSVLGIGFIPGRQVVSKRGDLWDYAQALAEALGEQNERLEMLEEKALFVAPVTSLKELKIKHPPMPRVDNPLFQTGEGWVTTAEAFVLSGKPPEAMPTFRAQLAKGRLPEWERHPDHKTLKKGSPWLRKRQEFR